jgi:nitrate/TMAO reductase-like tetraheme cytochrome c subunit
MTVAAAVMLYQEIPEALPEPPVPSPLAAVIRWFFHVPQWIQIGGAILGVIAAGVAIYLILKWRVAIWTWVRTRPLGLKLAMVGALVLIAAGAAWFGQASWHYTQHANEFCQACHVMDPAVAKFTRSEHYKLECHDCHQQPIAASMRQVYLWVLNRPEDIGEHAPVPDRVCVRCHVQEDPDSTWQRISATAGHRVHLESDSSVLAQAQCVTCHGREVHKFVPANETCGQTDCHRREDTRIALGAMSDSVTAFHCVACHEFTRPVSESDSLTRARQGMVPTSAGCLGCHEMRTIMADFNPQDDPHKGICGACHNPHGQRTPEAAAQSCTSAGCHANADTLTAFHRGLRHSIQSDCAHCHQAHNFVAPTQCSACHRTLR